MDASNMTHAEHYRLNGSLTPERIEALLTELDEVPDAESISDLMLDACTGFPEEDALDKVIDAFQEALDECDPAAMTEALEKLRELSVEMQQSAEHGAEQLGKAQELLGWRTP